MDSLAVPRSAVDTTHVLHAEAESLTQTEQREENLFVTLLHHVQDSREIDLPGVKVELPFILVERDGIHTYTSSHTLLTSGRYDLKEGQPMEKVVRASDGKPPMLDASITKHVVFLWVAAVLLCIMAIRAARKNMKNLVPRGWGNVMEIVIVFIRDEIVIPNMGHDGIKYMSYLLTTFFYILLMNLLGLIPYCASATGNVSVTAGLAIIAFVMIQASAIRAQGLGQYLAHLTGGVHWSLWIIMIPIEVLGLFTKAFALCIRLFANMTGGHIVIVSLIGLIFIFKSYIIAVAPIGFAVGINFLELFVAFLQAYIFTMLTSLFMGLGMVHEGHEASEAHGH